MDVPELGTRSKGPVSAHSEWPGDLLVPPLAATVHPAYSQTMPCTAESARHARQLVTYGLALWDLEELVDAATLCVSELVANAVQHSGARIIRVTISRPLDSRVRIGVTEKGRALPVPRYPGPDEEHGRGLVLINRLSDRWGTDVMRWGKRVWCEFCEEEDAKLTHTSPDSRHGDGDCRGV